MKNKTPVGVATVLFLAIAVFQVSFSWSMRREVHMLARDFESRMRLFVERLSAPTDKYAYLPELVSRYLIVRGAARHPKDVLDYQ